MKKIVLSVFLIIASLSSIAQLEIGVFVGGSFYMGDLNPSTPFLNTNLAYGLMGRYNLNSRWAIKVNGYKGILSGDDEDSGFIPERALTFESSMWELAGTLEFNFLPYFTGSLRNFWTPYIFAGFGVIYNRPQVENTDLKDFGTEGQNGGGDLPPGTDRPEYSYTNLSIPFGIGVKYSVSRRIALSLEWGMRKTFTDYLDDVSTTYYLDPALVQDGTPEAESLVFSDPNADHLPMMQRGNSQTKDWYSFVGFTITYNINLGNNNKCPVFQENF